MRRFGLVVAALGALAGLGTHPPVGSTPGPDAAIVTVAGWTAWLAGCYLATGLGLAALTVNRRSSRLLVTATPATARRLVERVLGVSMAAALASGGVAAAAPTDGSTPRPPAVSVDWPVSISAAPTRVVVEPGDSLWELAARGLDRPDRAAIAVSWPRWWHRNRRVIGADPNLIVPGQRLRPPDLRSQ